MSFAGLAGLGGIAFVLVAIVVNAVYVRARIPLPLSGQSLEEVTDSFAAAGPVFKRVSVLAPASWLFLTVFAAGLFAQLWNGGSGAGAWALVGFSGVLAQNATFAVVEALRFGTAAAAAHGRGPVAGLWGLSNVLFGFNQVFLAIALIGFTAAGAGAGLLPLWQTVLGFASAALLFVSASAGPYNVDATNRIAWTGLTGWLGWAAWIVAYSVILLGR